MHEDKIANATCEQYSGYEPSGTGSEWIIDTKGTEQVSNLWRCYFGGGETIDIDGDGVQDTLVKGEINIGEYCYFLCGLVKPVFTITNVSAGIFLNSERDSGKVFEQYFQKHLNNVCFQNTFGKLFIKRISECLDYKFSYTPKDGTGSRRPC